MDREMMSGPSGQLPLARIYLVRHGETQANRDGIIQGQLDTALNALGETQALRVGEALKGVNFTRAYSSDLGRAAKTAEAILVHHPGVELVKETALRERFMGELEGKRAQDGWKASEAEKGPAFCKRAVDWWKARILGSVLDSRAGDAVVEVLVTSHGGWIKTLVHTLVASRRVRCADGVELGHTGNASVTVVEVFGNKRGVVVRYGDASHLERANMLQSNADEVDGT